MATDMGTFLAGFSICDFRFAIERNIAREDARSENKATNRIDQRAGGGSRNWKGEKSERTPLAASRIGSANTGALSTRRTESTRVEATARRKLVVSFAANVRANPCACGRAT